MATIDSFDISVYNTYALRIMLVERYNQELRTDQASTIPSQVFAQQVAPQMKMSEMDLLFGIIAYHTPWAYFFSPIKYIRRSPFAFYRVAPSLGTLMEQEVVEEKLDKYECSSSEEEEEKKVLQKCFKTLNKLNRWLGEIIGRMGGLLPG